MRSRCYGPRTASRACASSPSSACRYTRAVVACDPGGIGPARLARWIAFGLGLSLAIAFVYAAIGVNARALVPKEETGWVADVFGWAGNSPYALFAAFVGIVLLAMGEHGVVRRRIAFLGAAAAFVQIPFTLKRMAVGVTGSAVTAMIALGGVRRYLAPLGIVIAVLVILFPPIQSRNVSEGGGVELEGRQYIWEQAIKRMDARDFVIGRGANAYFA